MKRFLLVCALAIFLPVISPAPINAASNVTQWTPVITTTTSASGSVLKDAHSVIFHVSSDFIGTILGAVVTGAVITHPIVFEPTGDHSLPAIAYTRTAGTLTIIELR